MADVDGVAEAEHGVAEPLEEGVAVAEVGGSFFQPLAEPLGVLSGPSVRVCGHKKHADGLTYALKETDRQGA